VFLLACSAGTIAPSVSANTLINSCPTTTANLNALHTGTIPNGARLRWHTVATNPTAADSVATPSVLAASGTYYAYYFDQLNDCYSPASAAVTATITACSTCATPSVGGTATYTGGAVCSTNNMGTITLSGKTGDVVKWQTSTNNGALWTDIAGTANKNSCSFINAANGQQYRAVVNSGSGCVDAYSSVVTIATSATACTTTTCSYNSGSFSPAITFPTTASLTTHIVLVNPTTGTIAYVTSANSAAFTGVAQGDYLLYAITYDNTISPTPTLTVGTNISTLTGCLAVSDQLITKVCINNPPVITSAATATTPENVSTTTPVYTATATDPNSGQTLTFSLETGGADNGKFTIDPTTGAVTFIASPDFEAPTDANGDNIYEIIVKSCDNGTPQYCATKTVQITVTDVIECAGFAAPTTTVSQPTCAVATGTITVTAPANNVTYSFDDGTTFQATATSSALASGTYQVKVKDNTTNCISTATATIINAQPASPVISNVAKTDASLSSCPALNDGTISVTAIGTNLQYSINNGATWQVSNSFAGLVAGSYTVKVKDNTSTCEVAYTSNPVVLTAPICNLPPTITSAGTATTPENVSPTTPVYTVTSTDPNVGQTPIYSFETGGVDNGKFNIDPTTGVVTFIASPDFETPTDADGNNIYEIKVKVCDNGTPPYCATKTVSITVTDVTECPIASVGGTTNYTGGTLCNTTNSGVITLTGKTGNVLKWQTSTNGGTNWTDIVNTTTTLTFTNAANNQQYRAVVNNSGACADANSTAKTITTSATACSTACDAPIPVITGH
jgi:large repetitive protein